MQPRVVHQEEVPSCLAQAAPRVSHGLISSRHLARVISGTAGLCVSGLELILFQLHRLTLFVVSEFSP